MVRVLFRAARASRAHAMRAAIHFRPLGVIDQSEVRARPQRARPESQSPAWTDAVLIRQPARRMAAATPLTVP